MRFRAAVTLLISLIVLVTSVAVIVYYSRYNTPDQTVSFIPQQLQKFAVDPSNENPINVLATTLPQFAINLADQKFKNLWIAQAADRQSMVESHVVNAKGDTDL
jgi:hypothetical protein